MFLAFVEYPESGMAKPEHEFFPVEQVEWTPAQGGIVAGLYERILATDSAGGVATCMLRFDPGTAVTSRWSCATRFCGAGSTAPMKLSGGADSGLSAPQPMRREFVPVVDLYVTSLIQSLIELTTPGARPGDVLSSASSPVWLTRRPCPLSTS